MFFKKRINSVPKCQHLNMTAETPIFWVDRDNKLHIQVKVFCHNCGSCFGKFLSGSFEELYNGRWPERADPPLRSVVDSVDGAR